MRILLSLALILLSTPALASASLACSAEDKAVRFSADAVVSRGLGEQVPQFSGQIELLVQGVPEDFRKLSLSLEHLTQRWLHGGEVKLRIYREREGEPHARSSSSSRRARAGRTRPSTGGATSSR